MFTLIAAFAYLLAVGALLWGAGRAKAAGKASAALPGVLLAAAIGLVFAGGFWLLDLYSEKLWFDSLGYGERFTQIWTRQAALVAGGAVVGGAITWGIARSALAPRPIAVLATLLSMLFGATAATTLWSDALLFQNATMTGVRDPVLGKDVGFYLFRLPLLRVIAFPLASAVLFGAAAAATTWAIRQGRAGTPQIRKLVLMFEGRPANWVHAGSAPVRAGLVVVGLIALLLGYLQYLRRYALVIDGTGFPAGAGYVDARYLIPAQAFMALVLLLAGAAVLVGALRRRDLPGLLKLWRLALAGAFGTLLLWLVTMLALPALVQRFRVSPNELAAEQPYILRSIAFTRRAFAIDSVVERVLPATGTLTPELAAANQQMLREIPLWDYRALMKVFSQFQEIRLYYAFHDVDIDRYDVGGTTRQVMLSVRELDQSTLPEQSRTFLNQRFKYTHGHGVVAVPVADFTPDGQPRYLVSDIPARSVVPGLAVTRPEVYFGEMTTEHVYVNSREPEFDYPSGEQNVESFYEGDGGVVLNSFVRKLAYAKRFDGTRLLFARHVTPETRVLFRRQIRERVTALAPFLTFDDDPYIVISEGRLFWIVDAYTSSANYPYSEHVVADGRAINYLRNSVKVVVDAYNGTTDFYVTEPDDPIVRTWARALPHLFKPASALPDGLRAHLRYPEGMLIAQGTVYAKYHMSDLNVFYNNEDLWQPATEKYYAETQAVEPYYMLWNAPGSAELEFIQMWPFTPRGRNVMAGWIAGGFRAPDRTELFSYRLPKDRQVLGPLQFEAKIDQDEHLVQLMTLWGQGGSNVIRGHVLSVPIGDAIVHIEPIYLESQSSSFPELQLVAVMQGDQLGYGPSLDAALQMLFGQRPAGAASAARPTATATPGGAGRAAPAGTLGRQASDAFEAYLRLQAEGRFEEAGRELARVRNYLRQLAGQAAP
jgi:uncharacterized protein